VAAVLAYTSGMFLAAAALAVWIFLVAMRVLPVPISEPEEKCSG